MQLVLIGNVSIAQELSDMVDMGRSHRKEFQSFFSIKNSLESQSISVPTL